MTHRPSRVPTALPRLRAPSSRPPTRARRCALPRPPRRLGSHARCRWALSARAGPCPTARAGPAKPDLLPPRAMPKRTTQGVKGRVALLHSLAHIELNAIDMTWDLIGRFIHVPMPQSYYDNWVQVGFEEAKHFGLLSRALPNSDAAYGDLPAHDGLWQAAQATGEVLLARLAVVPLVLEARGLDVSPSLIERLDAAGDTASADIIEHHLPR